MVLIDSMLKKCQGPAFVGKSLFFLFALISIAGLAFAQFCDAQCQLLSITDLNGKYIEADKVRVFAECYEAGAPVAPAGNESIDIEISDASDPAVIVFTGGMLCGETKEFGAVIIDRVIYRIHAKLVDTTNCTNCEGFAYFTRGTAPAIQIAEMPTAFTAAIAVAVVLIAGRRRIPAGEKGKK